MILNPKASIAIAMVLHELSTNAAKYGALSVNTGRLDVAWHVEPGGDLVIDWRETGETPATAPAKQGVGSRMINAVMHGELNGTVNSSYEANGLVCKLVVPHSSYIRKVDHA